MSSIALASGLLSGTFLSIILWNTSIVSKIQKWKLSMFFWKLYSRNKNKCKESKDTHQVTKPQSNDLLNVAESSDICAQDLQSMQQMACLCCFLTVLGFVLLIPIGKVATSEPTKYLYITYFKEYNLTVTIKV